MNPKAPFHWVLALALASQIVLAAGNAGAGFQTRTSRLGLSFEGEQLGRGSESSLLSHTGRYAVFASKSSKVVAGDDNKFMDVFIKDRKTKTNELVSVSSDGVQGNSTSYPTALSGDGRFVVFTSEASTFASPDVDPGGEESLDVFIRDRLLGTTERVSVGSDKTAAMGPSFAGDLSDDGRFVVFESGAANLVPNDDNFGYDIFVRDRELGTTEVASVRSNGELAESSSAAPSISADGRYVAFESGAELAKGDSNRAWDSFVHDRESGKTKRISVTSEGKQSPYGGVDPDLSADGRMVLFYAESKLSPSDTNNRGDAYLYVMKSGAVRRISRRCKDDCYPTSISATGRYLVYASTSPSIVPNDTNGDNDYFLFDRKERDLVRVNVSSRGRQARGEKGFWIGADVSGDGRFVAFDSSATNLVGNDTNNAYDTFLRGPLL